MERSKWLGLVGIIALMGVYGCKDDSSTVSSVKGIYIGDYSRIEGGVIQAYRVTTTITDQSSLNGTLTFSLQDLDTQKDLGSIAVGKSGSLYTLKSSLLEGPSEVQLEDEHPCANEISTQPGRPSLTTICLQPNTISLFSTNALGNRVLIYLNKNSSIPHTTTVKNGQYALSDLFHYVLTTSYSTRIATENLYQAAEATNVARAGLLPNLSVAGIVSLAAAPLSATASIGQLVPFLFPSNWYALDVANYTYQSQATSYKALVANQMNLIEDLYHSTLRDAQVMQKLQDLATDLQTRRLLVAERVQLGYERMTDLTTMDDLIYENAISIGALQTVLTTEYASLSTGIGLSPRSGIQSLVEPPQSLDFSVFKPIVANDLMAEAESGSLDIRQTLYLEAAASSNIKQQEWSVVSPTGWISLNEATIHTVKIAKSNLVEINLQQHQTEQAVQEQVISLAALYNELLAQNIALTAQVNAHKGALESIAEQYQNGTASILTYRTAIEDMIQLEVNQINSQSSFVAVQGKLDRLLWRGAYLDALQLDTSKVIF